MTKLDAFEQFLRQSQPQEFWIGVAIAALLALTAITLGFRALHRARMMEDMPTSRLRSAAQGYVELEGRARMMPGEPIHAPLSGLPCTWYSYRVEYRDGSGGQRSEWKTIDSGVSDAIFFLEDDTGRCIVDPDGAKVTPSVCLHWRGSVERPGRPPLDTGWLARILASGRYRYTEQRINENDPVYAVGHLVGLGEVAVASLAEQVKDILATWKKDPAVLLRRFDADGNGRIDGEEWEAARAVAEREAIRAQRERPSQPAEHNVLRLSPYGKPFVISTISQHALIRRERRVFLVAVPIGLAFLGVLGWVLRIRFGW